MSPSAAQRLATVRNLSLVGYRPSGPTPAVCRGGGSNPEKPPLANRFVELKPSRYYLFERATACED